MTESTTQAQACTKETNNQFEEIKGILSCDIGLKHMVFCFNETSMKPYEIFTFDIQKDQVQDVLQQLWYHVKNIIDSIGKEKIRLLVIEGQIQGTLNIQIMYAICMIFTIENIYYQIQPARAKYSIYKDSVAAKNFKIFGAQDVSKRHLSKNNIVLKYNKLQRFVFKNHRWYQQYPELRDFLQKNQIEKFDDIADTILMIEEYRREQQKILQKSCGRKTIKCATTNFVCSKDNTDEKIVENLQQLIELE